jgi:tetratricopeptide (TPR) repeat protein
MRQNMKKIWLVGAGCILAVSLLLSCASKNIEKQIYQAEKYRQLGELLFKEGKYTSALKEFLKAEALNPNDYFLQNDFGLTYLYKKRPDLAIPRFKKALALKDDYSPARNNLGNAYAEKREWDKAIEQYKIVTEDLLYGTPQYAFSNLGLAYYEKKDYRLAEKYFLESLDVQKDFSAALYGLGKTYMTMGRVTDAIIKLEKAAQIAPDAPRVHFELGKAYTMNREYKKAYDAYQQVVELDPDSPLADSALKEARKIKYLF